jgi:hypothetical protein
MQGTRGHVVQVGLCHVVGLDLAEHLGVDAHLPVSAILLAAGMDAQQPKLTQRKAQAKGGTDRHGKNEDKPLKELRHTHHRGGFLGKQAARPLSAIIAQEGAARFLSPTGGEYRAFRATFSYMYTDQFCSKWL